MTDADDPNKQRQLAFELPLEPRFGRQHFLVSSSNEAAYALLESWPEWPARVLLLLGPTGAGKSHVAAIWAERAKARVLAAGCLKVADLPAVVASGAVLIEDADRVGEAETELFHLLNLASENAAYVVLTARAWPMSWGVRTPDLLSRLRQAPAIELGEPDDALVRAVLVKLFIDRQLVVDTSVVDYLALRIERSLAAARTAVIALDREALARGRRITRPMAADVLKRLERGTP